MLLNQLTGNIGWSVYVALIFYRFMFLSLEPGDFTPPYWINMGALAISTLAVSTLVARAGGPDFCSRCFTF